LGLCFDVARFSHANSQITSECGKKSLNHNTGQRLRNTVYGRVSHRVRFTAESV